MTKKIFAFILAAAMGLSLLSCKGKPDIVVSEKTAKRKIVTTTGKTISIELKSQISTGFSWRLERESEKIILLKEEIITLKQMPGAPELHKFMFRAEKKGMEKLKFNYARHWLKKSSPEKTFTVEVEVQ